jgi:hypothetical protein
MTGDLSVTALISGEPLNKTKTNTLEPIYL